MSSIGSIGMRDPTAMQAMRSQIFKTADQDSSGGLNLEEFQALASKSPTGGLPGGASVGDSFKSFDADGDGSLSQDELDTGMKSLFEASFPNTVSFAKGSQTANLSVEELLSALDGDGDGSLSKDELQSALDSVGSNSTLSFARRSCGGDGSFGMEGMQGGGGMRGMRPDGPPPGPPPGGMRGASDGQTSASSSTSTTASSSASSDDSSTSSTATDTESVRSRSLAALLQALTSYRQSASATATA